jgi:hypothetical protein
MFKFSFTFTIENLFSREIFLKNERKKMKN